MKIWNQFEYDKEGTDQWVGLELISFCVILQMAAQV